MRASKVAAKEYVTLGRDDLRIPFEVYAPWLGVATRADLDHLRQLKMRVQVKLDAQHRMAFIELADASCPGTQSLQFVNSSARTLRIRAVRLRADLGVKKDRRVRAPAQVWRDAETGKVCVAVNFGKAVTLARKPSPMRYLA